MAEPTKYRTRSVEVEAYRWDGTAAEMYLVVGWILTNGGTAWIQEGKLSQGPDVIRVEGKDAIIVLYPNSWVVRDLENNFLVFTDDVFKLKYVVDPSDI